MLIFWKTVENHLERIKAKIDQADEDSYIKSLQSLSIYDRALWGTVVLQIEVENGGFDQFFWNIEDERFYKIIRDSLMHIHALSFLEIYDKAYKLIEPHLALMHTWQGENDRFDKYKPLLKETGLYEKFRELSSIFYNQKPNLDELRKKYFKRNKKYLKV